MQSAVLATPIPSACLSVCPSDTRWYPSRRMTIGSHGFHYEVAKTLSFTDTKIGWGQRLLSPYICARTEPPPEKRQLRRISGYNVTTVKASEQSSIIANRKSTTRFPMSYR